MPLDHGCRLDQHHHLQAARPNPVEPGPQQAIASTKPRSAGPLPVENGQLMPESQDLQFQRGPTPKPEGNQRGHCGQDRKHSGHDKAVGAKLQCLQSIRNYEQPQRSNRNEGTPPESPNEALERASVIAHPFVQLAPAATKNSKCAEKSGVFGFIDAISPACLRSCDRSSVGLDADFIVGRWWNWPAPRKLSRNEVESVA